MATKYKAPSPPFIGARHHGGSQTPKGVVIHATVSPDNAGTARQIANWWHGPTSPVTSAHYVVDPKEIIQCVGDHTVAYHCGYNTGTVSVELCDEQVGPVSRWQDTDSKAIIARAARLTAEICLAYNIEPVRPSVAELRAKGPHGIYGHNDSRLAFGNTSHSDPRDFDWPEFLRLVRKEIVAIKGGAEAKPVRHVHKVDLDGITYNTGNTPDEVLAEELDALAALRPQVIGLTEVADRKKVVAHVKGYKTVADYSHPSSGHCVLLIRDDLRYAGVQLEEISPATEVERKVAGSRRTGHAQAKYILSAVVRVDGEWVRFGVVHFVPSTTKTGVPKARALYRRQVAGAVKWATRGPRPKVLMGDLNGGPQTRWLPTGGRPLRPLARVLHFYPVASHGKAKIDHVALPKDATGVSNEALDGFTSDHRPVRGRGKIKA